MNNPFDNYDLSLRAINGLKDSGFKDMDNVLIVIQSQGIPTFLKSLTRCSSKTKQEIIEVLTEQGFIEPEPEENVPELEYPQ